MNKDQQGRDGADEAEATPGHTDPAVQTEEPAEALRAQLEEAQAEARENFSKYQRALADFQNYKRRTEEQRADYRRDANAALVINILPAIDDLDRALASVDVKLAGLQWIEGIRQIQRKFQGALTALDVTEIEADGVDFDPRLHEAVGHIPGEEGKVVQVLQKGYTVGDRVVRPAMVMVGNGETDGQ
ncbi:MAG: nucleotide exchange factor GrpE [Dehalococcoidia bacterium]